MIALCKNAKGQVYSSKAVNKIQKNTVITARECFNNKITFIDIRRLLIKRRTERNVCSQEANYNHKKLLISRNYS